MSLTLHKIFRNDAVSGLQARTCQRVGNLFYITVNLERFKQLRVPIDINEISNRTFHYLSKLAATANNCEMNHTKAFFREAEALRSGTADGIIVIRHAFCLQPTLFYPFLLP